MLIVLLIVLLFMVMIVLWLLIVPIRIVIDSPRNIFKVEVGAVGSANFLPDIENPKIRLRLFWWKKDVSLLPSEPAPKEKKTQKKRKSNWSFSRIKRKATNILKTFDIKLFDLRLDTDNYFNNALLYPVFYFLNRPKIKWSVNYEGEVSLRMVVQNRLIKIVYAFIK